MKLLITLLSFAVISSAQASYMATHCSNTDASVTWETGHNSNTATFKIYGQKDVVLSFYDLDVNFTTETIIDQETIHRCGYFESTQVLAGKVLITASAQNPTALDFLGEDKQLKTEVICKTHINGRSACPEETIQE